MKSNLAAEASSPARNVVWRRGRLATTLALLMAGAFGLWKYGLEPRAQATDPTVLDAPGNVVDLWFNGDNLLALEVVDSTAIVWRWTSDSLRLIDRRSVNLHRLARVSVRPRRQTESTALRKLPFNALKRAPNWQRPVLAYAAEPATQLAWTVNRDGTHLAWLSANPSRLLLGTFRADTADSFAVVIPTDSFALVGNESRELAFNASGVVGIYGSSGRFDLLSGGISATAHVGAGMQLRSVNDRFVLIGRVEGDSSSLRILVIDPSRVTRGEKEDSVEVKEARSIPVTESTTPSNSIQPVTYPEFREPLAISQNGTIAIGTAVGDLYQIDSSMARVAIDSTLASPGISSAIRFLDDQRLLVVGGFRGVHLLAPGRESEQLTDAPIGTTLLASEGAQIAFSTGHTISVADVMEYRVPSDAGTGLLVLMFMVGVAGISLSRRESTTSSPKVVYRKVSDESARRDKPEAPPPAPQALMDALSRGDCILIAGGGLGVQAGLPVWDDFLAGLADTAARAGVLDQEAVEAIDEALANSSYTSAAEELERAVPPDVFRSYVGDVFGSALPAPVHQTLGRLPFAGAVTTNYDRLLLDAFAARMPRAATSADAGEVSTGLLEAVRARQFFLLNMLGRVDRPETLVFTSRAYRDILANDLPLKQLLRSLFERYNVLFVGMALSSIRDFLDAIEVGAATPTGVRHFALVGQGRRIESYDVRTFRDKYGIDVLGFVPGPSWNELNEFLASLASALPKSRSASPPTERPRITRLVLDNIGPFDKLDVTLAPHWNVILGDNGVGKTVALRAIAAALLGRDVPATVASRLLRTGSGAARGKIEVYGIGPSPYAMEFKRDLGGRPTLEAGMVSPLRLSKWLVIAFPALRALPAEPARRAAYDEKTRLVPLDADLLSLATDAPDGRASDLRTWLRHLALSVSTGRRQERERAVALQQRFAEIVAALTPGAQLEYLGVNADDGSIEMLANGRPVPLEFVSQGTASVLCWVGVLLQRMYEVHHELDRPEEGPTLVLIDEIDAHMHPAWQRQLAPTLRKHLPNLQVLATTHSPMIVGSMKPEEIFLARRRDDTSEIVRATFDDFGVDPESMGVGQLLTSPLFSLETEHANQTAVENHERYIELASRLPDTLTPAEQAEFAQAEAFLSKHRLSPHDRFAAAKAYEVMEQSLQERLQSLTDDQRKRVVNEIKVQIAEASAVQRSREV